MIFLKEDTKLIDLWRPEERHVSRCFNLCIMLLRANLFIIIGDLEQHAKAHKLINDLWCFSVSTEEVMNH